MQAKIYFLASEVSRRNRLGLAQGERKMTDVEENVCKAQAKVPPPLAVVDVAASQELVRRRERTVLAVSGRGGVVQLARRATA